MLFITDLTYRIGGRTLLDKATVSIPAGYRIGFVGPNGAGKSTLFKLIAGELHSDGGEITMIKGASMGMVRQDLPDDDTTLIDIVLAADTERAELLKESETAEDPERIGYIYSRLEEIDAYSAPSRAALILAGLGFTEEAQNSAISSFSGGWRARVALAAALFKKPNLLLLDEPTNHLDLEALMWLETFLIKYPHTLVIISHDRDMLNKTVDHIVHLENQKLNLYTGNYDEFERMRAERMMGQQALREKQLAQKAHMQKFVDRFGATASKARQAQSRLKMIAKMDIVDAVMSDRETRFNFPEPEEEKSPLMVLEDVNAGYGDNIVLKKMQLRIDADDRIALLGANGNGKSTLMKLLSGRMKPLAGQVHKSGKMRVGYFAQFQTDELDVGQTAYEVMKTAMKHVAETNIRAALAKFGFDKYRADTTVGELSGGEKARLLFCLISYDAPHIMLLDEPTNHLDIDAREALMNALNQYSGAVILVSHDPHLVECVSDRLWLVADGTVKPYDDDLDAYRKLVVQQRRKEKGDAKQKSRGKKDGKKSDGTKKDVSKLEAHIAEMVKRRDALEQDIAACYAKDDKKQHAKLNRAYEELKTQLSAAEAELDALIADL